MADAATSSSSTHGEAAADADSSSTSSGGSQPEAAAASPSLVPQAVPQQRPYFVNVAAAHVAGLLAAFVANSITHMGQPAREFHG